MVDGFHRLEGRSFVAAFLNDATIMAHTTTNAIATSSHLLLHLIINNSASNPVVDIHYHWSEHIVVIDITIAVVLNYLMAALD
jgi:hypothetical protein